MTAKDLSKYLVHERETIKSAIEVIQRNHSRCSIIYNDNNKIVGVFSAGDVLKAILNEVDIYAPLISIMKPSFLYLNENDFYKAYEMVKKYNISIVPVVDQNFVLKDIITIFDVLNRLEFKDER